MSSNFVTIIFENLSGQDGYVQFLNGAFGSGQTGANGTVQLSGDTAYSLTDLTSDLPAYPSLGKVPNISLNSFTNGRMYLNLGSQGLQGLGDGYQPSCADPNDTNYNTRYGFIELNVFGNTSNNLDLSYIDFFGISMKASTWSDDKEVDKITSANGGAIINGLAPLSSGDACIPSGIPKSPYSGFVRIIGPGHCSYYHEWTSYFNFIEALSYKTQIAGYYSGDETNSGPTVEGQNYDFVATFDSSSQMVTLEGSCGLVGDTSIQISYKELNSDVGVYGANPSYTIINSNYGGTTTGIVNDVFGWAVGDLLSGLNMGFLGSKTLIPGTTTELGKATSSQWFAAAASDRALQFDGAQSNPDYYNSYAGVLRPLTQAYGFPFSDRLPNILLYFPPSGQTGGVDYLKITLLPDA